MVEKYSHNDHFELVEAWLKHYDIKVPDKALFSDIGFVVDKCAIGFLFTTNSKTVYIDHIVANPEVDKEFRNRALELLFNRLIIEATSRQAKMITVLAKLPCMMERFQNLGFSCFGEYGLYYRGI